MKRVIEKEWAPHCMICFIFLVVLTIPRVVNGVTIPYPFSPNTTISSNQMNQNFNAVATQMPGAKSVLYGNTPRIYLPATSGTLLSITVTVPGAGHVVVTASGSLYLPIGVAGEQMVRIKVSAYAADTSEEPGILFVRFPASIGTYSTPFSTTFRFSVTTAGTRTYYLNMWHQVGSGACTGTLCQLSETTLTAVFIPNSLP